MEQGQCIFRPTKIQNYSYFEITTNSTYYYSTYNFQTFGFHTSSWSLDFRSNFPIPNLMISWFWNFEFNFQFSRVLNFDFNFQFSRVLNFDSNFQFPYFGRPWVLNFDFNFHLSDPVIVQCWHRSVYIWFNAISTKSNEISNSRKIMPFHYQFGNENWIHLHFLLTKY